MRLLSEAILFAAEAHAGQFRKDGRTPYINHPLQVMHLLIEKADINDVDILRAAVLHDILEDTTYTFHDLAERFGTTVAEVVSELSDDKTLSKDERKQQQLILADTLSPSARLIRISDKICNVYDIIYAPPGNWTMERRVDYLKWAQSVVNKIRGTHNVLEQHFDDLLEEGFRFLS
ncbi:MAG: HD domain-containing protein [Bacteroidia bacterium]